MQLLKDVITISAGKSNIAANILVSMRPKQWVKNLFVFAPLIFSKSLFIYPLNIKAVAVFLIFCVVSGSVYIINDIADKDKDKSHPLKKLRPIASNRISTRAASRVAAALLPVSFILAYMIDTLFMTVLVIYFLINIMYSAFLKHVIFLDIFIIAIGFVLRTAGGGLAIHVEVSSWLILCTFLVALFLAMCKRRHELTLLKQEATNHRKILSQYSPYLLDQLIAVVTASTLITYALYTMSDDVYVKFGNNNLVYTIPFVLYGIFRYLYLVHQEDKGGNPTEIMMNDVPILINIGLWVLASALILYL